MSEQVIIKDAWHIAVLERGFVYVGIATVADGMLVLQQAKNIRKWGTTAGLGQLALNGPTKDTVLDKAGKVIAPLSAVIHLIEVHDERHWTK